MPDRKNGEPKAAKGKTVHIAADEVEVTTTLEVPEGHVVVEPPTAATPAVTVPETAARAAEAAKQVETSLRTEGQRSTSWLWESTQMRLALLAGITFALGHLGIVMAVGWLLVTEWQLLVEYPAALAPLVVILTAALGSIGSLAASVASSYFTRTNSHRTGGVGGDDVKADR